MDGGRGLAVRVLEREGDAEQWQQRQPCQAQRVAFGFGDLLVGAFYASEQFRELPACGRERLPYQQLLC